ncbi:MAG: copper chaperone PCu(A)C [Enhydrobacter sp.]|nr:copper chaperone PCu(A)C [Enhydrobacter sp.]
MSIDIARPWARTPSATALEAGGFLTLTNKAREIDRLTAATSPVAGKIAICGIKIAGPTMTMRPIERGLGLPPDTVITMKPRGYHLYFEDLKAPLAKGDKVPVTLTFEKAGTRHVELIVEAEGPIGNETLMEGYSG